MASRRMINVKIIDSARFLKMPVSTQALYFHLITRGDDDGIVEAFNVMRMTGATEDDLKILVAKNFVQVLNEDLVTFITDWNEHNLIRADRKVDSLYQNLLLQILPDVRLLEKKQKTEPCRANDGEVSADCQHSIGKDSIGYVSPVKDSLSEDKDNIPYSEIIDYLNLKANTKYKSTGKKTKDLIKARYNEKYILEDFKIVIDKKCSEWLGTSFENYLRPETLFSNKFEGYLNQKGANNGSSNGYNKSNLDGIGFSINEM